MSVSDFGAGVTHCVLTGLTATAAAFSDMLLTPPALPSGGEYAFLMSIDRLRDDGDIISDEAPFTFSVVINGCVPRLRLCCAVLLIGHDAGRFGRDMVRT